MRCEVCLDTRELRHFEPGWGWVKIPCLACPDPEDVELASAEESYPHDAHQLSDDDLASPGW